jgi:mRNA deadenylase 3'-5' endonuclease subunit Ccr4
MINYGNQNSDRRYHGSSQGHNNNSYYKPRGSGDTSHSTKYHSFDSTKKFPFNYRSWAPKIELDVSNNPNLIRIVSYNILCDSLLPISTQIDESELPKLPYLLWENRRQAILNEITELKPDLICFQEFERDTIIIEEFWKMGYDVIYKYININIVRF